jgi:hypothetical protein
VAVVRLRGGVDDLDSDECELIHLGPAAAHRLRTLAGHDLKHRTDSPAGPAHSHRETVPERRTGAPELVGINDRRPEERG